MSITKRIDNVTGIDSKYRGTILPPPKSVKIELTANCNYRCKFCVKSLRSDNGDMDRKMYSRLIREIHDAGVPELGVFYVGESFTTDWLPDAIQEAKDVGFEYVFCTTNGAACTPEKLHAVMEAGLDSLKFSVNFASPAQLQEVAQVSPRNFDRALSSIREARRIRDAHGFKTKLYASSIAFDGKQGELMRDVAAQIKPLVDEHYWLPLYGMSGAAVAAGWTPKPGNPGRLDNMRDPLPCWACFTEGHITKDGLLAACCFGDGIDGGLVMADLKEVDFMTGWNSPAFQDLRAAHLAMDVSQTPCAHCAAGS